ncbi:ABC transporter permease [Tepidiforma thermophila]|uniref:Oligopeptide transport system permease protein n=1 Tax=Tepidiforma thermophila (strain KCTC 52669 / CGMCC 1.13589 / G233) TaxID=2761530 RepID=A0A2A9HHG0_TEPT2|nr:ABC transporter permease [Tepidiforma thermophila]PFG74572.1 oligopeptide transport system permease protein [Tepidiforma thermophila]
MAATDQPIAQPFDFLSEQLHTKQRGLWAQAWQRLLRNRLAVAAGVILIVIAAVSFAADVSRTVQRYDPTVPDFQATEQNPSWDHWLGTDTLGRDLWSRLLQGTLFSLKIGIGTQVIVLLIGVTIGMAAALAGRVSDTVLMWITDLAYAFPDLLAIILLRQVLLGRDWPIIGEGDPQIPGFNGVLLVTIIAISFVSWTTVARLVRGQMLSIKEQDYVTAARAMGASPWRVVRVHMLPNTLSAVIVSATFGIPLAIFAEATLGFIGLGVPPPNASLGSLIGAGLDSIQVHPVQLIWPTVMVATLMLCFTFLGDGLRDALDPRTRR